MTISDPRVGQPDPKPLPPDLDRWYTRELDDWITLPDGQAIKVKGQFALEVNATGDGINEKNTDWSDVHIGIMELDQGITKAHVKYLMGRLELEYTQAALDTVAERLSSHDT
jgi:hypothetical protein